MFKIRSTTQLAAAVLASGCFALALGARADGGPYSTGKKAATPSAACESARLSAWFERQRELTEGDFDPFKQIATPRECAMTQGANVADETTQKRPAAVTRAPQQASPSRWEAAERSGA